MPQHARPHPFPRSASASVLSHLRRRLALLVLGYASACASWAASVPTTASFMARANIVRGCVISTAPGQTTGIGFGTLDFGSHSAVQAGAFSTALSAGAATPPSVQCTPGTTVQISADAGLHAQAGQRHLAGPVGGLIPYALWLVTGNVALPPGSSSSLTLGPTPTSLPVGGTATLPGAGLPAGTYTDTVQVTLAW